MRFRGTKISFEGRSYPSFAALYRTWNGKKPAEKTFGIKLAKWRKKHPDSNLTDEVIRNLFQTRSGRHGLTFKGVLYAGPKDLYRAYRGIKVSFGGFWQRLNEWRVANPGVAPVDPALIAMLTPAMLTFEGISYPSLAQVHKAIPSPKLGLKQFTANFRAWRLTNPQIPIDDEHWKRCARFMGGHHECRYKGQLYPNLKALFDKQSQPKCLWGTFQNRVRKLQELRDLTDDDFDLLLQPKAKVRFFAGILYRWIHLSTGKVYIGISSQSLKERIRLHIRQAKDGTYRNPASLQAAIAKHGIKAFKIEVQAKFHDEDSMKTAEEKAVREHNCIAPRGFNLQGGDAVGQNREQMWNMKELSIPPMQHSPKPLACLRSC